MVSCYMVPQSIPSHCLCAIFWMKVFTSLRWIIRVTRAGLSVRCWWARPPDVFVCSTQPFVWSSFGDWTRLGLAKWWLDKRLNIYIYAHIRHTISAHGDTGQLSYLFHSVFRSTLKNSSTLCIYGLVQVETSGKQWVPSQKAFDGGKRVYVKTSFIFFSHSRCLGAKKDRSYACKMPAALHMITSSYWYIFCVTGLISGKSMGVRLRWDMMDVTGMESFSHYWSFVMRIHRWHVITVVKTFFKVDMISGIK